MTKNIIDDCWFIQKIKKAISIGTNSLTSIKIEDNT